MPVTNQLMLLRETPAPPPLNRGDDLNPLVRHVINALDSRFRRTLGIPIHSGWNGL
jgi:hypothetical protein